MKANSIADARKIISTEVYPRIQSYVTNTPLLKNDFLSQKLKNNVYIKYDNLQISGSFKIRGACNKVLKLKEEGFTKVVTASTGNHALACATICSKVKMGCEIFIPKNCDQAKMNKIKLFGQEYVKLNVMETNDCGVCEQEAIKYGLSSNIPYISPYDDLDIVYGQGTIGWEISKECQEKGINFDELYVSVGGGGLISGIGFFFQDNEGNNCTNPNPPSCKVIGVQPVNSAIMYYSMLKGRIVDPEKDNVLDIETWSDGTAGSLDSKTVTFSLCKELVHEWVLVEEAEIKKELENFINNEQIILEGAAALSIAGAIKNITERNTENKNICIVLCGRNIGPNKLKKIFKD